MKVVIVGKPNAGKSSLLNALADKDVAIVTDIAGTTRDILREHIHIDGMPLHVFDTAGLRDNPDKVEEIGIARAHHAMVDADRILLLVDIDMEGEIKATDYWKSLIGDENLLSKVSVIYNKIDKYAAKKLKNEGKNHEISISATTGEGLDALKVHLKSVMGFQNTAEGQFSARRRHLEAIKQAQHSLQNGKQQLEEHAAGELLAEDLREAQNYLSEITGKFTPDDLLGKIFSSFCIGK